MAETKEYYPQHVRMWSLAPEHGLAGLSMMWSLLSENANAHIRRDAKIGGHVSRVLCPPWQQ